jgi:hypothetical protein
MVRRIARKKKKDIPADSTAPWQRSRWIRGQAHLAEGNKYLVLAQDQAEEYDVCEAEFWERLPFHLAGLVHTDSRGVKSFRLEDAVGFVRTYGLLRHGPAQLRNGDGRESLVDWRKEAEKLRRVLDLYRIRGEALRTKSIERVNAVRGCVSALQEVDGSGVDIPENDRECLEYAGDRLSEIIDRERAGCRQHLVPSYRLPRVASGPAGLDDFVFIRGFPNLLAAAYDELALHVAAKAEVLNCEECRRPFRREHGNQTTYCSQACGNRLRQRRYREKQKGKQSDGQEALGQLRYTDRTPLVALRRVEGTISVQGPPGR